MASFNGARVLLICNFCFMIACGFRTDKRVKRVIQEAGLADNARLETEFRGDRGAPPGLPTERQLYERFPALQEAWKELGAKVDGDVRQSFASVLYLAGAHEKMKYYELGNDTHSTLHLAAKMGFAPAIGIVPSAGPSRAMCEALTAEAAAFLEIILGTPDLVDFGAAQVLVVHEDVIKSPTFAQVVEVIKDMPQDTPVISRSAIDGLEAVGHGALGGGEWFIQKVKAQPAATVDWRLQLWPPMFRVNLTIGALPGAMPHLEAWPHIARCGDTKSLPCICPASSVDTGSSRLEVPTLPELEVRFKNLQEAFDQMKAIYKGQEADAYNIKGAKLSRSNTSAELKQLVGTGEGAVYGEIIPMSVAQMLYLAGAEPGMKYYDLGSGFGKTVTLASILGLNATGVEATTGRFNKSCQFLREQNVTKRVPLLIHSILERVNFTDADIIFADSVLFPQATMKAMAEIAAQMKNGSIAVTAHGLKGDSFENVGVVDLVATWSPNTRWYIQRVVGNSTGMSSSVPPAVELETCVLGP